MTDTTPEPTPMTEERWEFFEERLGNIGMISDEPWEWHELANLIFELWPETARLRAELAAMNSVKNNAYRERNRVVAALAKLFPSGVAVDPSEPDWPVLYIDLPDGQVSWHFQRSEAVELLAGIPKYEGEWDGHSTEEKYARLKALAPRYFHLADFLRGSSA